MQDVTISEKPHPQFTVRLGGKVLSVVDSYASALSTAEESEGESEQANTALVSLFLEGSVILLTHYLRRTMLRVLRNYTPD